MRRAVIYFMVLFYFYSSSSYSQSIKDTSITIYFGTNKYMLDSINKKKLIAFCLSVDAIRNIIGYADTVGTIKYNEKLSKLRADMVYNYLRSLNITTENTPLYMGELFPQDSTLDKNRKVEIKGYTITMGNSIIKTQEAKPLEQVKIIKDFSLDNIYFIPDKAIISPESILYVRDLAKELKSYEKGYFEIIGHVNYQSKRFPGSLKDMYKLSEDRAKAIHDLFVEQGIPAERIKYRGVGNSQPAIKDPKNDEERKKNMRVQIVIFSNK